MDSVRIVVADEAGACYGVERALSMVRKACEDQDRPVSTLGPLIHNPIVVEELASAGVRAVDTPEEAEEGILVLRAHGVTPAVEDASRTAGLTVLDGTCPFVKRVHKAAERLAQEGYDVLVAGEEGHAEVVGTIGHAPGARVVSSAADVGGLELGRRVGVVVQTTLERSVLASIVGALSEKVDELRVYNTICDATEKRQNAAAELAARSDVMVVLGGSNSANTRHLANICRRLCDRTYHIQSADELHESWFAGVGAVGITAGASTPQAQIAQVKARIEELCGAGGQND